MNCRHCGNPVQLTMLDLGSAPPSNAYLTPENLAEVERWYPLRVGVCQACWLAQTEDMARPEELFAADYAYFSGFSSSWLAHCEAYVTAMVARFDLDPGSHVVEVAANDGSLLQYVRARGIPCTGVEPTAATAAAARAKGLDMVEAFFGVELAQRMVEGGRAADLIAANNVLAHVPDINDFVAGFAILLKPGGVATFEFPHLLRLLEENQFDTVYHEHYSYLSFTATQAILAGNGLEVFDVEALPTHGGSLRVYAQRADSGPHRTSSRVADLLAAEAQAGMRDPSTYAGFQDRAERVKNDFLSFLLAAWRAGQRVGAYGAAAKGNTLLNFAGVRPDLLLWVADRNPAKQGKFLPGSRIPVVDEGRLLAERPDYVVILPWNLTDEISRQLAYVREWGGRFVTAIPALKVLP